jgi:hypothetical protein
VNASPLRVSTKQALHANKTTSEVAAHEAGHVLVGLKTGRKLLRVWVRGGAGCVEFEPFRWFPGGVARIRRGLAVDVAGFLAEDLAAGRERERLSHRLAGGYSGPIQIDDRAAVRKAWAIRTGELLDDYHTEHVFWQQAGHGRHEDIRAEIVRAERRAGRILKRQWVAFLKLAHALSRRPCRRMDITQVRKLVGRLS